MKYVIVDTDNGYWGVKHGKTLIASRCDREQAERWCNMWNAGVI